MRGHLLWLGLLATGCDGTSLCESFGTQCADPVEEAMSTVESAETWAIMQGNGDGLIARVDLFERGEVPGLDELVSGGDAAAERMRERLRTGDGFALDHALSAYAYALGKRRDTPSLEVLADLVEVTSFGTDLDLAPHAATDAIFQILGDEDRRWEALFDYDLATRDEAVAAARPGSVKKPASTSSNSCRVNLTMAAPDGTPITYQKDGQTVTASLECSRYRDFTMPPNLAAKRTAEVLAGGGTYVAAFDGGQPSRRYNCAGFSFRELTSSNSLNCSAPNALKTLTAAGLLTKKPVSEAVVNDKIFFFQTTKVYGWATDRATEPAHVVVVHSVAGGEVIVRAPDNHSGVFDAPLDAEYFVADNSWEPEAYEWTDGVIPRVISTVDPKADPRFCDDSDDCAGACSSAEICLDGACVPKTEKTSCELRVPQCCPGQDNSCTASDAACYCDAYCVTANDCCPDACSVCGYCE